MLLKNTKVCRRCKQEKLISEFSKSAAREDGLQHWCKECLNKANRDSRKKKALKEHFKQMKRLSDYKLLHGLEYEFVEKQKHGKLREKIIYKCLGCGKSIKSTVEEAWQTRFKCTDCFKDNVSDYSNKVLLKNEHKCSCGHNCQNHNQENKVVEYPMMTDDWIKYLRELHDNDNPQHLETIKIVYFPVSAQVETQSNKTKENLHKKENRFIKWFKKLFNKK